MTRAQRNREADALLCAARHWQNSDPRCDICRSFEAVVECYVLASDMMWELNVGRFLYDIAASAALSEAARLSDTEIVDNESEE
jgi:hypothetical protein